jgi:hypothetical protein
MNRRTTYESRFRRRRLRGRHSRSFWRAWSRSRWNFGRCIGKQVFEHIKSGAVQRLVKLGRRRFHLCRRRQIGSLLAQLAKGWRRFDHHHSATLGTRQNLPNRRLIAHSQTRPARRTRDCKSFHALVSSAASLCRVREAFAPASAPLQNGLLPRAKSRWQSSFVAITHEYLPAISEPTVVQWGFVYVAKSRGMSRQVHDVISSHG